MHNLKLEEVSHSFDRVLAVDDVTLSVSAGEIVCLVGPSGCGKTTLLRLAAGLEQLQTGRVAIGNEPMADATRSVPPEKRDVGLVFQDYALFPHLCVQDNVAFGLHGLPAEERMLRTRRALDRTGMLPWAGVYPHELSGGQQQRVALARALAPRPRVVLLDEPFSGLDAQLRDIVREEAVTILRETGVATLMVTHDPEEAMYVADRIAVMRDGRIDQVGRPDDIYLQPQNAFVAAFFGEVNRFAGHVAGAAVDTPLGQVATNGHAEGMAVEVLVRPEALRLGNEANGAPAIVRAARFVGRSSLIDVALDDGQRVRVRVPGRHLPADGERVHVHLIGDAGFVFARSAPK